MRRFFVPRLATTGETLELNPKTSHHILRVCGLAPGEKLELFDGQGSAALANLVSGTAVVAQVEITGTAQSRDARRPVWLLQSLLRGPAFDTVIRMATEIGASAIWPILAERSVAKGDRWQRWDRIATAAAGQSGRSTTPTVSTPAKLNEAIAQLPTGIDRRVCIPGASPLPTPGGPTAVLLGPEGGLTSKELEEATTAGFKPTGLGSGVLRADTAAAVALAQILSMDEP